MPGLSGDPPLASHRGHHESNPDDYDNNAFPQALAHKLSSGPRAPTFPSINERPRTVPFLCSSSPLWRAGR